MKLWRVALVVILLAGVVSLGLIGWTLRSEAHRESRCRSLHAALNTAYTYRPDRSDADYKALRGVPEKDQRGILNDRGTFRADLAKMDSGDGVQQERAKWTSYSANEIDQLLLEHDCQT